VILANSRKHNGRCIAGIELVGKAPGDWIRPVSDRSGHEVNEWERNYEEGTDPQVLDVVSVPLLNEAPTGYQTENWLLNGEQYWIKEGRLAWEDLELLESDQVQLWSNEASDSYHGVNDRITSEVAAATGDSLRLIRVDDLRINVVDGRYKRQVRANFTYLGARYDLGVTDPLVAREYLAKVNGTYSIGEAYLAVSLGEEFDDGYCYKLVAAVITEDRADGDG
jgi:hypothetical protein